MSYRTKVSEALKQLCAEAPSPATILFRTYFSAAQVAVRAKCSESTARKHLDELSRCRGFRTHKIRGTVGYRYDGEA